MKEVEVPNVPNGSNGVPIGGTLASWWGTLVLKAGTLLMMTEGRSTKNLLPQGSCGVGYVAAMVMV